MVRVIPGRIENGHVVPEAPLPSLSNVRSVSILVEISEPARAGHSASTLPKLLGLLKNVLEPAAEYGQYLEAKYR